MIVDHADHLVRCAFIDLAFPDQLVQIVQLYVALSIRIQLARNL